VGRGENMFDPWAVDGGLVTLDGGKLQDAGDHNVDLFVDGGTSNDIGILTISVIGIDSPGVEASKPRSVELNHNTIITNSGILSLPGFSAGGAAMPDGTITLENSSIANLIRRANRLEAGAGQNLISIGQVYSTRTVKPAMLAINGGTILSIDDQVSVLPPRGITGVEAEGIGSRITAENITILALGLLRTGISGVEAVNGGLVTFDGRKIEILSNQSVGFFANSGTINGSSGLTITMAGIGSRGVEASGTGLVELGPNTTIHDCRSRRYRDFRCERGYRDRQRNLDRDHGYLVVAVRV
jgi:hypothetical protein